MANLTYNPNIFTNVRKWDEEYTYLGIQISGKLNQYNGQDYPLLDAIDIDWNGAYINVLNTYVNTTEDLIYLLNQLANFNNEIPLNYYSKDEFNQIFIDFENSMDSKFEEAAAVMEENIIQNMLSRYELLNALSAILIDQTRYLEVEYINLVKNNKLTNYANNRQIFIRNEQGIFAEVSKQYILQHPEDKYYIFIMSDIITLNDSVDDIYEIIGKQNFNSYTNSYSYTGFFQRFYNVESDLTYLSEYLDNNTNTTILAYNYAYNSYITSNENKEKIGYHTRYNVYEKIDDINSDIFNEYISNNNNNVFIKDPNDSSKYLSIQYSGNPNYEYYILHPVIPGTGIEKEIEDINTNIADNSYILYHLHTKSNSAYVSLNITPENNQNRTVDRTITLNLENSYINDNTGEITNGIANHETIIDGISYLFGWEILK